METIGLGVLMFTGVILSLVAVLMVARSQLVASGEVELTINDDGMTDSQTERDHGGVGRDARLAPSAWRDFGAGCQRLG